MDLLDHFATAVLYAHALFSGQAVRPSYNIQTGWAVMLNMLTMLTMKGGVIDLTTRLHKNKWIKH